MKADNDNRPERTRTAVTVTEAEAAGLSKEAATVLAAASERLVQGYSVRNDPLVTAQERKMLMTAVTDVLAAVGIGDDARLFDHYICNVLTILAETHFGRSRIRARGVTADALRDLLVDPKFVSSALDALDKHLAVLNLGQNTCTTGHRSHNKSESMTRQWILCGGWKAYWVAIDLLMHLGGQIKDDGVSVSLDRALAVAFGYAKPKW